MVADLRYIVRYIVAPFVFSSPVEHEKANIRHYYMKWNYMFYSESNLKVVLKVIEISFSDDNNFYCQCFVTSRVFLQNAFLFNRLTPQSLYVLAREIYLY